VPAAGDYDEGTAVFDPVMNHKLGGGQRTMMNDFHQPEGENKMRRKARVILSAILWVTFLSFSPAAADEYPTRPISLIVQFSAGTTTDIIARKIGDEVGKILGQPIVCINKTGGGGTIGVAEMIRSKPDGYTIGCINMPALAIIPHMQEVPYDPLKDIAHVCVIQPYEYALYVKADSPWNSLKDFVEYAQKNPGKVIYGSVGVGTTNHLVFVRLAQEHNLSLKHVPYRGDGEIIPAMLGGHVDIASGSPAAVVPQVKAGKLKLLVVTSKDRWTYLPEVPTLLESGSKFYQSSYFSVGVPAATPEPIRKKLEEAFRKVLQDPAINQEVQEKLSAKLGYMSGADFAKYIQEQHAFYKGFLKQHEIK
jgi:tripartite-type tricarboxylate transporter receptor subunit TctC